MTTRINGEIVDRTYSPEERYRNVKQFDGRACKIEPPRALSDEVAGVLAGKIELALRIGQWDRVADLVAEAKRLASQPPGLDDGEETPGETPLADLVSMLIANCLERECNVIFAGDAVKLSDARLLAIPNFGPVRIAELDKGLARVGLRREREMAAASPAGLG